MEYSKNITSEKKEHTVIKVVKTIHDALFSPSPHDELYNPSELIPEMTFYYLNTVIVVIVVLYAAAYMPSLAQRFPLKLPFLFLLRHKFTAKLFQFSFSVADKQRPSLGRCSSRKPCHLHTLQSEQICSP